MKAFVITILILELLSCLDYIARFGKGGFPWTVVRTAKQGAWIIVIQLAFVAWAAALLIRR